MKRGCVQFTSIVIASLLTVGCATTNDRYYVQREWSKSLRELGIVPFFPPREDVFVGDVYAYGYDPQRLEFDELFLSGWEGLSEEQQACRRTMGMSPRLARLGKDISTAIDDEYANTISAPRTTAGYDNIVGNPAWDAADSKVKTAQKALDDLQQAISAANSKVAVLTDEKQKLQWAATDAQTAVTQAEAALNSAKSAPIDVSAEQALIDQATADILKKEDAKLAAERASMDLPTDAQQTQKDKAAADVLRTTRELEDAKTAKNRADNALTKKQAQPRDVAAKEQELSAAKTAKSNADNAVIERTRQLEIETASASKIAADSAANITAATTAVESAKAIREAIAKSGAGLLQAQPRDGEFSIFRNSVDDARIKSKPDDAYGSRTNRLRLVGFPEFATVSFSQGDLSALIPIEALGLGANISKSSIDRVSVKVPAAESYSLSAAKLMGMLFEPPKYSMKDCKGPPTPMWIPNTNSPLTTYLPFVDSVVNRRACVPNGKLSNKVYLHIVTEAYYARALDIALFSSDSFGLRAQLASPTTMIGEQKVPSDSSNLPAMVASDLDVDKLDSATATALLAKLQSRLGTTQTVPGGSIQIVNYSERSIGLRRVFDRPIAIGMRGITIEYDPASNEFGSIGSDAGATTKGNKDQMPDK